MSLVQLTDYSDRFSFTPRFSEVLTQSMIARSRFSGFRTGNC